MPVRSFGFPAMVRNPGFEPSRTEGAADVNIETGVDVKYSKSADFWLAFMAGRVDQGIRAGL